MGLATELQEKLMETFDDNINSERKVDRFKAILAAFISGAIDGAVVMYPFMCTALFAVAFCNRKKCK